LNAFSVEFPFCVVPAGGEGVGECYTLAERYRERIRCFTLAPNIFKIKRNISYTHADTWHQFHQTLTKSEWRKAQSSQQIAASQA
jgi:hypothetical protein